MSARARKLVGSKPVALTLSAAHPAIRVFGRLIEQRNPLEIHLEDQKEHFFSHLLEVVREEGYLVFDHVMPASGNEHLRAGTKIEIKGSLEHSDVKFSSMIEAIGGPPDNRFYKVPFPSHIDYPRRRDEYRAPVPLGINVAGQLRHGEDLINVKLRDLSSGGFSAHVSDASELVNETYECTLALPDQALTTQIMIRHRSKVPHRGIRFGACFMDLSARDERRLDRAIAALQRTNAH